MVAENFVKNYYRKRGRGMKHFLPIMLFSFLFACTSNKKEATIESTIPEETIETLHNPVEFEYFGRDTLYSTITIKSFSDQPDRIKISDSPRSCDLHLGQIIALSDSSEFRFIPDQSIFIGVQRNYHWGQKKLSFFSNSGYENLFAHISNSAGTIDTICILKNDRTIIDFTSHPHAIDENLRVVLDFRDNPEIVVDTFNIHYITTGLEIRKSRYFDTLLFSIDSSKITLHNYHEKSSYGSTKKDIYYRN